tara:strand:+ start:85 stop:222 length:138 start_codon:yes stop_codon:yes gene_type:complete
MIALKIKTEILVPKHDLNTSFFIGLGILLFIVVVAMYLEKKKQKI